MDDRIGVDAGGSLIKIAYEEKGHLHLKKYPQSEWKKIMSWLEMQAPNHKLYLTGGKAGLIKAESLHDAVMVDEFEATCEGASFLLKRGKMDFEDQCLLVNIGTGTSWFLLEGDRFRRVFGSGVGGGTFMGLGNLLTRETQFSSLVDLAETGNRSKVDLLVKDLYFPNEPPIPGDLTASNFAKATWEEESAKEDQLAALVNMIAETITLLTMQVAMLQMTTKVVYIGSTLVGNKPLKNQLEFYTNMSGLDPVFLPDGEFSGAIGARMM